MTTAIKETSSDPFPYIYLGSADLKDFKAFNAAAVHLDARLDSNLDWEKAIPKAKAYIDHGLKILWEMNFGLFKELHLPLSDTSQYRSLNLALDHFFESFLKEFSSSTIGISIYKGSLDFSHDWSWDVDQVLNFRGWLADHFRDHHALHNELGIQCVNLLEIDPKELSKTDNGKNLLRSYCTQAAMDYFSVLTSRFESDLLPFLLLDSSAIKSKTQFFQLLDHEDIEFMQLAIKKAPYDLIEAIGWESPRQSGYIGKEPLKFQQPLLEPHTAVVIPSSPIFDQKRLELYDQLIEKIEAHKPCKLISERNITLDWQGIDELIVLDIEADSKRKLEGFIAAGGKVISQRPVGLSEEQELNPYLKSLENS